MLTTDEVKRIIGQLSLGTDNHLIEEISRIVYRVDVFRCGDTPIISRHIDIEFMFGDYYG